MSKHLYNPAFAIISILIPPICESIFPIPPFYSNSAYILKHPSNAALAALIPPFRQSLIYLSISHQSNLFLLAAALVNNVAAFGRTHSLWKPKPQTKSKRDKNRDPLAIRQLCDRNKELQNLRRISASRADDIYVHVLQSNAAQLYLGNIWLFKR